MKKIKLSFFKTFILLFADCLSFAGLLVGIYIGSLSYIVWFGFLFLGWTIYTYYMIRMH